MSLNFLNPSRSFDSTKRRINFWGYDRVREISCFVGADALKKLCPDTGEAEASFLTAFDNARERICKVAARSTPTAASAPTHTSWSRTISDSVSA